VGILERRRGEMARGKASNVQLSTLNFQRPRAGAERQKIENRKWRMEVGGEKA
jgi:hypothetical protein